jgi:hypothetical protein
MTTVPYISLFRWRSALLWRTFFTTAVVAVVLRGLIGFCRSGKCGLFGQGGLIMFDLSSTIPTYSTQDTIGIVVLGVIGGVFGGLFNFLLDRILRAYSFINEYESSVYICLHRFKFYLKMQPHIVSFGSCLQERCSIQDSSHHHCIDYNISMLLWAPLACSMHSVPC